jgi:hypothetical protein
MRAIGSALTWLVAAIAISLGAAGIVAGMERSAAGADSAGLTARGDALVDAHLDRAQAELTALSGDVDALGVQARGALAALTNNDADTAAAALASGDELVTAIRSRAARIAAALEAVPLLGTPEGRYEVSDRERDRHARLMRVLESTRTLEGAWASVGIGSIAASRLSSLLAAHVEAVLAAAAKGRAASYPEALTALDEADAAIADSRVLRDQLARTLDVSTLDGWLDRNEAYDVALRALYTALVDSGGTVTDAVRRAAQGETDAKAQLPGDSRGLILIMSEIGRGGMNGAVVAIEQTRGRLADALAAEASEPAP